jgi:hypothetical protein
MDSDKIEQGFDLRMWATRGRNGNGGHQQYLRSGTSCDGLMQHAAF